MKIGTMLKDVVESFFKKSNTQLYPFERTPTPQRFRGNLQYNPAACTAAACVSKTVHPKPLSSSRSTAPQSDLF